MERITNNGLKEHRTAATRHHRSRTPRWAVAVLLLAGGSVQAQLDKNTYVVEAYDCKCGGDTLARGRNSIQLGVRLNSGSVIHTALSTLIGCGEIYLNVDGDRFPMRVMSVNEQDGLARLEPVNVAGNAVRVEQLWKAAPRHATANAQDMEQGEPEIMVLHGPKMLRQPRTLSGIHPRDASSGLQSRYQFDLPAVERSSVDHITGGPVWFKGGDDRLLGIITEAAQVKAGYKVTCVGTSNVLDDERYRVWKGDGETVPSSAAACNARQHYWNRIEGYMFRDVPSPEFGRISADDEWRRALREALLRIKAHQLDSLATKGAQSLCVFNTDLENAAANWTKSQKADEPREYRVLALFIKHYSDVHCKQRRAGEKLFDAQVLSLNANLEQITTAELDLLLDCGLPLSVVEAFTQEQYALSQMAVFAKRSMVKFANEAFMSDPCNVKAMLAEIERWIKLGGSDPAVRQHPSFKDILELEPLVADLRAASIEKYTLQLANRKPSLAEVLTTVSQDSCLTTAESMGILERFQATADAEARRDLEHGTALINDVRAAIERIYGKEKLEHVDMKLFPVDRGVGIAMSVLGGGAAGTRSSTRIPGLQADTTTLYRKGFPLGGLGDDIANAIARELWARICRDQQSAGTRYEPVDLQIMGMADGNLVRGRIAMPDACRAEITALKLNDTNKALAFARAWTLSQAIQRTDACGLMEELKPRLLPITFEEKGPQYRGVSLRLVVRRP